MREVLVIGSVLLDIVATYHKDMDRETNKIGVVRYSVGGVGYNIAANLAAKHIPTSFLTCLKTSSLGTDAIKPVLEICGFNSLYVVDAQHIVEPAYVAHSREGQLISGITSCEIDKVSFSSDLMTQAIKKASLVAVETNLSRDQIWQIAGICKQVHRPLVVSIVSGVKAGRIFKQNFPCQFELVALNSEEAAHLEISVDQSTERGEIAGACRDLNSKQVIITRGSKGYQVLNERGDLTEVAAFTQPDFRNDIGAGDALFAAVCAALVQDEELVDGLEVRARVTNWVTSVLAREESNLGPTQI